MGIREVLARNFQALRAATPSLSRPKDIVDAGAATNGTIGRIANGETGTKIDQLERLADAYHLEAWQLLVPDMDPKDPPRLDDQDVWPFPDIDRERFYRLSLRQQIEIQGVVRDRIERFEHPNGKKQAA